MTNEQMIKIIQKAVDKYGEKQLDIAQEEFAELIQALSKYKRAITPEEFRHAKIMVIEELVDAYIMLNQICLLLDLINNDFTANDSLNNMMEYKLRRLDKRMENE